VSKLAELQASYETLCTNIKYLEYLCEQEHNVSTLLGGGKFNHPLHEDLVCLAYVAIAHILEAAQASKATYKKKLDAIEELLGEQK
jgi:hypothetical protein